MPNVGDATDQDFALVCYNCAQFPDFTLTATPAEQNVCAPADAVYSTIVGSILGYNDSVTLSATGNPMGSSVMFVPNASTPPFTSTMTVGNLGAATPGSYDIEITGMAPTSTHTTTVSLNLFNAAFGGKFNVARNLLINASVLVALNSRGVTARFTPVVGFDYAF